MKFLQDNQHGILGPQLVLGPWRLTLGLLGVHAMRPFEIFTF